MVVLFSIMFFYYSIISLKFNVWYLKCLKEHLSGIKIIFSTSLVIYTTFINELIIKCTHHSIENSIKEILNIVWIVSFQLTWQSPVAKQINKMKSRATKLAQIIYYTRSHPDFPAGWDYFWLIMKWACLSFKALIFMLKKCY